MNIDILSEDNLQLTWDVLDCLIDYVKENDPYATNTIADLRAGRDVIPARLEDLGYEEESSD